MLITCFEIHSSHIRKLSKDWSHFASHGIRRRKDLEETINKSDVDLVIIGTPIDLTRVMKIKKPYQRVRYELQEIGQPTLQDILMNKFGKKK
jgi:predicted GTPase